MSSGWIIGYDFMERMASMTPVTQKIVGVHDLVALTMSPMEVTAV